MPNPSSAPPRIVLVVDDDAVARSVAAGVLREAGMRPIEADSGETALELLKDWPADAALVDHSMPGMSGLELTQRMRQMPGHHLTPILFLSASDSHPVRLAALRAGASDFMVKPVPYDEVVARLESQMELASKWAANVRALEDRAGTLVGLAGLGSEGNPVALSRLICERVSAAHAGTGVAVYAWAGRAGIPTLIASTERSRDLFAQAGPLLSHRGDPVPWIEYPAEWTDRTCAPAWVVCCPLRHGLSTFGLLVIEGGPHGQEELVAATMDYAPTVALLLGPAGTNMRLAWESRAEVEEVLSTGGFEPLFQPIVEISTGRVLGYEALTRITTGSTIVELLARADEAGMRGETEIKLLAAALRQSRSLDGAWMSVNLSPSVVVGRTQDLAELIGSCRCHVVIELTENERIEDYPAVGRALTLLGTNVRLSVDDTGSGYASLRHVITLHPHFLKLDRSWISGLDQDETRQALVAGMAAFCRHTHTEMIAEGVETAPELDTLRRLDVRLGQGYLLGRPVPAGRLARVRL
jgi:EAL domain-containing protein (putative c-di-GMP-specific phosphodiesterase class I)/FixJ family two-component response regulator